MAKVILILEDVPAGVPDHCALRIELRKEKGVTEEESNALRIGRLIYNEVLEDARQKGGAVFSEEDLRE